MILILIAILLVYISFYKFKEHFSVEAKGEAKDALEKPKIWTFWHDTSDCPTVVSSNFKRIKKTFPNFEFIVLTNDNVHQFVDSDVIDLVKHKIVPHKTDLYRLFVLKKYGGIWVDSSVVLRDVDFINNMYIKCVGLDKIALFETQFDNNNTGFPVLESWFILSPKPENYIINLWYNELVEANKIGFDTYKHLIEKQAKVEHVYIYGDYLTIHACMQYLLQTKPEILKDVLVYKSEDSMFYIQQATGWNSELYRDGFLRLAHTLPCIKMRGGERTIMSDVDVEEI